MYAPYEQHMTMTTDSHETHEFTTALRSDYFQRSASETKIDVEKYQQKFLA